MITLLLCCNLNEAGTIHNLHKVCGVSGCIVDTIDNVFLSLSGFSGTIKIYSLDFPARQLEYEKNLAWTIFNDEVVLGQWGDCFIPRTPGNVKGTGGVEYGETVSLELYNKPGYFIMQKNYKFVIAKKDPAMLFSMFLFIPCIIFSSLHSTMSLTKPLPSSLFISCP